ncbi:MAG: family 43 glycosylhydrolase [Prevotella sp.]|nr:family 43 glycosylhydrolase [Prevotella sp.]
MKRLTFFVVIALVSLTMKAEGDSLMVQFDFLSTHDTSGKYVGTLHSGATLSTFSNHQVLDLGENNGYFEFDEAIGSLIGSLDENYAISVNVYIPEETDVTGNGNFIWCFAKSSSDGYLFFCAKDSRFAITKTNYEGEETFNSNTLIEKGRWHNVIFMQRAAYGRIFVDGKNTSNKVSLHPNDIGKTVENYLGKSCYAGDAYLKNAKYSDFRIFNYSLDARTINSLRSLSEEMNAYEDSLRMLRTMQSFTMPDMSGLIEDITLPTTWEGIKITWQSSNEGVITSEGHITRPPYGYPKATATLTATLTYSNIEVVKEFEVGVMPEYSDEEIVSRDTEWLQLNGQSHVYEHVTLPTVGMFGSVIFWKSSLPEWMSDDGRVLQQPEEENKEVLLTATLMRGKVKATKNFTVYIRPKEPYENYLFVYFPSNSDENIYYAISEDGYNYTPLNWGRRVVAADTIALKGGVRDPHILRGHDGWFYMVNTDMQSAEGWDSNRGIVMMKSRDLIHWTHSTVHFPERFAHSDFADGLTRVWAPETIWDADAGKYMVYFSLRTGKKDPIPYDKVYYCYANDDFTDLETFPVYMYDRGSATIDMDIVYNERDSLYHAFYKTEGEGGICKVTAKRLTAVPGEPHGSQWSTPSGTLQQTSVSVEGAGVFKLINKDTWTLMYDCYTSGYYQFCSSEDLENFHFVRNTYTFGAFTPRHGTVIPITKAETEALVAAFPYDISATIKGARDIQVRQGDVEINGSEVFIPVKQGTDISSYDPQIAVSAGATLSPTGKQDFSRGAVTYTVSNRETTNTFQVTVEADGNPVIPDFHADPEVLFSQKTGRFYVYPTTDGYESWGGYSFDVFSSSDLVHFTNEGTFLNLKSGGDVPWATGNAWAPCIEEKWMDGKWKYFFYFSGQNKTLGKKTLGVATAESPTGPFIAKKTPLFASSNAGQMIDSDVFTDPVSGQTYFYYGNGRMCYRLLSDDMMSVVGEEYNITPTGGTLSDYAFREGTYVFYRNGIYYFLWSVDDTGATNYHVAYGTSTSPTGPIKVASQPIVIIQEPESQIYGTGHNSIVNVPGTDDWYIVYHRINKNYLYNGPGIHREVCVDKLTFDADGKINPVTPTRQGITPVKISNVEELISGISQAERSQSNGIQEHTVRVEYLGIDGCSFGNQPPTDHGIFIRKETMGSGKVRSIKIVR